MAIKDIQFNSFDLQDDNFRVKDILYRDYPEKVIDLEQNARRDGFRFIRSSYFQKAIRVTGTITRDTEALLKTSIDAMKEALHTDEANLDIDDNGTTIRWVCSIDSIRVPEEHYHITRVPFDLSFKCQPFGKETSTTVDTKSITNASASPYVDTFNPTGSAGPRPVLKFAVSGSPSAAITTIRFTNTTTNQYIEIPSLVLNSGTDYLEIDCENMTVNRSYDGGALTAIDYTGVFPTFVAGSNSYSTLITGGGATWTLTQTIAYYHSYL